MKRTTLSMLSAALAVGALPAQFTVLAGPCDFGVTQVVGESAWLPGAGTRLGFDLLPDGTPIATPLPVPLTALFASPPLTQAFASVGVVLDGSDVAVSQPSNPTGLGLQSLPNALAGAAALPLNFEVGISFVDPGSGSPATVPAAGLWVADGPTNDTSVTFFDGSGAVITTLVAGPTLWFAGIEAPAGIGGLIVTCSAPDDFFVDDLHFGPAPFAGGVLATETVRVGTPPNPAALLPGLTSGPVLGEVWDPVIDHAGFLPSGVVDLLAIGGAPTNVPFPAWGTILCDQLLTAPLGSPAGVPFAVPWPHDCALMGVQLTTQGVSTDGAVIALTNALDVTLGNR